MWENIQIESTCIETSADKAVLINMPKKSKYKGYCFWHPAKCCRLVGKNNYLIQISFTNDFKFTLKKMGKGKFNYKEVLDTKVIGPDELKKSFGYDFEVLDDLKED